MVSKLLPKMRKPGSSKFPQSGAHNPNVGTSGSGMAPIPSGGANMPGNAQPNHPPMNGLARVKNRPSAPTGKMPSAGSFTPVQNNAMANLMGQHTGQAEVMPRGASARISPQTQTPVVGNPNATTKPKRKGLGAAFWGEMR